MRLNRRIQGLLSEFAKPQQKVYQKNSTVMNVRLPLLFSNQLTPKSQILNVAISQQPSFFMRFPTQSKLKILVFDIWLQMARHKTISFEHKGC